VAITLRVLRRRPLTISETETLALEMDLERVFEDRLLVYFVS